MISRVLSVSSSISRDDGLNIRDDRLQGMTHRKLLRYKLMTYFVLGLLVNCVNLSIFIIHRFKFKEYYIELSHITSCGLASYLVLNLYFLDVLRDGVLNPPRPKLREVDSSVARGDNRSENDYPEMFEQVELNSRDIRQ
jgi:hypothetical protein